MLVAPKNKLHLTLAHLSAAAHQLANEKKGKKLPEIEEKIDQVAAELWGITPKELEQIQKALKED